jgi:hypothetical protein
MSRKVVGEERQTRRGEGGSKRRHRGAANRNAHGTLGLASWVSREASRWRDPGGYIRSIRRSTWAISVERRRVECLLSQPQ